MNVLRTKVGEAPTRIHRSDAQPPTTEVNACTQ